MVKKFLTECNGFVGWLIKSAKIVVLFGFEPKLIPSKGIFLPVRRKDNITCRETGYDPYLRRSQSLVQPTTLFHAY